MHDRPTAAELVEAVREFLEADVMPATDGRVQFHVRVSVNALRMVERELAARPAGDDDRAAAADLAGRIRSGAVAVEDALPEVRAMVREKLLVANPDYLASQ